MPEYRAQKLNTMRIFEYRNSIVDTTSERTGFTSKRTSKSRSYTQGSSDDGILADAVNYY
jgi:hypothetical protein